MQAANKKAIQIEFDRDDYDEAYDLISTLREAEVNIGKFVLNALRDAV